MRREGQRLLGRRGFALRRIGVRVRPWGRADVVRGRCRGRRRGRLRGELRGRRRHRVGGGACPRYLRRFWLRGGRRGRRGQRHSRRRGQRHGRRCGRRKRNRRHGWHRRKEGSGRGSRVPRINHRLQWRLGLRDDGGLVRVAPGLRVNRDDAQRAVEPRPIHVIHAGEADDDGSDTEGQRTDEGLQEELSRARPPRGGTRVNAHPAHAGQAHERSRPCSHEPDDHEAKPREGQHTTDNVHSVELVHRHPEHD